MKKRITMILGLVCLSTLTACSNSENVKEKHQKNQQQLKTEQKQ